MYGACNDRLEEDDDEQAAAVVQLPAPPLPFWNAKQMHESFMEYLKTGHHLGPIDEWDPPEDPE